MANTTHEPLSSYVVRWSHAVETAWLDGSCTSSTRHGKISVNPGCCVHLCGQQILIEQFFYICHCVRCSGWGTLCHQRDCLVTWNRDVVVIAVKKKKRNIRQSGKYPLTTLTQHDVVLSRWRDKERPGLADPCIGHLCWVLHLKLQMADSQKAGGCWL